MSDASTVFRDFVVDGVPSSGVHNPSKSDIRTWAAEYEAIGAANAAAAAASAVAASADATAMLVAAEAISNALTSWPTGGEIFVSAAAEMGLPAGSDTTGTGTLAAPYATLTKALAVATSGQTIRLNGDPSSPRTYSSASGYGVTTPVAIDSIYPFGAKVTSGSTTRVFQLSADTWFGAIDCDGNGGVIDRIIDFGVTTPIKVTLSGTRITDFKSWGIYTTSSSVSLYLDKPLFRSNYSTVKGAWLLSGMTSGGVFSLTGYRVEIGAHGVSGWGAGGHIHAVTEGTVSVYLVNPVIRQKASASGVGSVYFGLTIRNIRAPVILAPDIEMDMSGLPLNSCAALLIQPYSTTPLDSSGFVVAGLRRSDGTIWGRIHVNSPGSGYGYSLGYEAAAAANGYMNGGQARDVTFSCSEATAAAGWHAILNGCKANTAIVKNIIQGGTIVLKEDDGAHVFGNVVYDQSGPGIHLKGSVNTQVFHNTLVVTAGAAGSYGIQASQNTTGTDCTGCVVSGNLIVAADGSVDPMLVSIDAGQGVTLAENHYWSPVALDATAWRYQGTGYASVGAWAAVEPTASYGDPGFTAAAFGDYSIPGPSQAAGRVSPMAEWIYDIVGNLAGLPKVAAGAYEVPGAMSTPATTRQLADTVALLAASTEDAVSAAAGATSAAGAATTAAGTATTAAAAATSAATAATVAALTAATIRTPITHGAAMDGVTNDATAMADFAAATGEVRVVPPGSVSVGGMVTRAEMPVLLGSATGLRADRVERLRRRTPVGQMYLQPGNGRTNIAIGWRQGARAAEWWMTPNVDGLWIAEYGYIGAVRAPTATVQAQNFKDAGGATVDFASFATTSGGDDVYVTAAHVGYSFEIPFTGTGLIFSTHVGTDGGRWSVSIDGVDIGYVSVWAASSATGVKIPVIDGLPKAAHTAKFTFAGDDPSHVPSGGAGTGRGWFNYENGLSPTRVTASIISGDEYALDTATKVLTASKVIECAITMRPYGAAWAADWVPAHNASTGVTVTSRREITVDGVVVADTFPGWSRTVETPVKDVVIRQVSTCWNPGDTLKASPLAVWALTHHFRDGLLTITNDFEMLTTVSIGAAYAAQVGVTYDVFSSVETDSGARAEMTAGTVNHAPGYCRSIEWSAASGGPAVAVSVASLMESCNLGESWRATSPVLITDRSGGAGSIDKCYWLLGEANKIVPAGTRLRSSHSIMLRAGDPTVEEIAVITADGQSNAEGQSSSGTAAVFGKISFAGRLQTLARGTAADVWIGLSTGGGASTALDGATITGLADLVDQIAADGTHGTTAVQGLARARLARAAATGVVPRHLVWSNAEGGQSIANLLSTAGAGYYAWTNALTALTRAVALCPVGRKIVYRWQDMCQGESDTANASLGALHEQYRSEMTTAAAGITGQSAPVKMISWQPSGFQTSTGVEAILAQALTAGGGVFFCGGPTYPYAFGSDYLHQTSAGHVKRGEASAAAMAIVDAGGAWTPLHMVSASVTGANEVTVVLSEAAAIDAAAGVDAIANAGITLVGATISGVTVTGTALVITTSDAASGATEVRAALSGQTSPRTAAAVPRTNIRSTAGYGTHSDGSTIRKWLAHQRLAI